MSDLLAGLERLQEQAEAKLALTREVPELQGVKDIMCLPAQLVVALAEAMKAGAAVAALKEDDLPEYAWAVHLAHDEALAAVADALKGDSDG